MDIIKITTQRLKALKFQTLKDEGDIYYYKDFKHSDKHLSFDATDISKCYISELSSGDIIDCLKVDYQTLLTIVTFLLAYEFVVEEHYSELKARIKEWSDDFSVRNEIQPVQCPECLRTVNQMELDIFGGLCESCTL